MRINNKNFGSWDKEDLKALIESESLRESEYVDYKRTFAFLESSDKNERRKKQNEFRNDICSFANADGGYIFFGIDEEEGLPVSIYGVEIENVDKFESQRRIEIEAIQPVKPNVEFSFIPIAMNRYVVVLQIQKGIFKPYITVEEENTFRFFIRHGNKKHSMSYMEIANQFLSSRALSETISLFRNERINVWKEERGEDPFFLIHLIPATFQNIADQIPLMDLLKNGEMNYQAVFNGLCGEYTTPNVDGIYFPRYEEYPDYQRLQLYNNGTVELEYDVDSSERDGDNWLKLAYSVEAIEKVFEATKTFYCMLHRHATVYICVAILGCKGMISSPYNYQTNYFAKVDRNRILCTPIEIRDILDEKEANAALVRCKKEMYYALGIKKAPQ